LREESLVSIIIPTFNSARFLEQCITSIKKQTHWRLEVIVVDDGSTDSTLEIAERYGCNVVKNPKRGRAEAKNEGAKHSSGKYLLFVDSDMELTRNVVSKCVELADDNPSVGGIVIPEHSIGDSFWTRVRDFERCFYAGSIVESARFFPAKLAVEVGGFEEDLVFFEESTLPYKIQRKGYNVFARVKLPIFHHEENFQLLRWLEKKFRYGKTLHSYKRKYSGYSKMQIGIWFRLSLFVKDRERFWGKPRLALGTILLKSLEYFATVLGFAYSELRPQEIGSAPSTSNSYVAAYVETDE
jgi:glycosyltransferase involved in cell wall biosynthesis